jgi:hypothetical protein
MPSYIFNDLLFEKVWPANTTPVAVDGSGTSGRNVAGCVALNAAAAARFIRLFDKASAPTMGTDQAKLVIPIEAGKSIRLLFPRPPYFQNGLWVSVTTGIADNDNTAPAATDILLNILYE